MQETAQGVNPVRSSYVLCDVFYVFYASKQGALFVVLQIYDMLNGKDISFNRFFMKLAFQLPKKYLV